MTNNQPVASSEMQANLYAGSAAQYSDNQSIGSNIFIWITLTMVWVLMILAILALLKYVTGDNIHARRDKKAPRP
jgi:hypothetical protein